MMDNYTLRILIDNRNCAKCETLMRYHLGVFTLETINALHIFSHPEHRMDDTPHIISVVTVKNVGYSIEDHTTQRTYPIRRAYDALNFLTWYNRLGDSISFLDGR